MCECTFCKNYRKYKWAIIMECKCGCHEGDGMTGHDNMCCSIPNGLRKNNPYKAQELKPAAYYEKIIKDWENSLDM